MKIWFEEIGKIQKASINIKDLTIFVGKNSTNKSYVAQTIYTLNKLLNRLNSHKFLIEFLNKYLKYDKTKKFIKKIKSLKKSVNTREEKFHIYEDEYDINLIREVSIYLDNFEIDELIKDIKKYLYIYIIEEINRSFNTDKKVIKSIFLLENLKIEKEDKITFSTLNEESDEIFFIKYFIEKIIEKFSKYRISDKEYYFPASRTGFVLAFDEIVSGVLRDRFGGQPTATKLTEPTIDYISFFADIKSGKFEDDENKWFIQIKQDDAIPKLFKFIEKRIIKGKIVEDTQTQRYTQFFLESNNEKFALHLSSSSTVELLPLIVFLKHFRSLKNKLLIIEEPEAHLHPEAQIEMARLIVMLINAGAKVIITTHSDYILNEISNCIKVGSLPKDKQKQYLHKYNLNKNIILDKSKLSSYLFKNIDNSSVEVKELNIDKYGIENDNFDEVLDELLIRAEDINSLL